MKQQSLYFTDRKEYYRRKAISESLKEYYAKKEAERPKRIRKQYVLNSEYNISFRAVTINGTSTVEDLRRELKAYLRQPKNKWMKKIPFFVEAEEQEEIDRYEDQNYSDGKIYIEVHIRGVTKRVQL